MCMSRDLTCHVECVVVLPPLIILATEHSVIEEGGVNVREGEGGYKVAIGIRDECVNTTCM